MRFRFHSTPVMSIDPRNSTSYAAPAVTTDGGNEVGLTAPDRVASGRYRPEAPTDPYVLALEHTVLQIMGSLPSGTQHGYPFLFR